MSFDWIIIVLDNSLLFLRHIIYNNIYGFHHNLGSEVIYSIGSACGRVSQEYSFFTFWLHLSSLFSISKDIAFTSKNMEVLHGWLPSFPNFIESRVSSRPDCNSIQNVTCCIHGYCPEMLWQILGMLMNT